MSISVPVYEADLVDNERFAAPYEQYQTIRDLGPVVRSASLEMYIIARYVDVRSALRADSDFISGNGASCKNS